MRSINVITILGNVGQDPKIIDTKSGNKMATFSVATTRRWKNDDGQQQEETQWHRCLAFDNLAKIVEQYITKGKPVHITGEMRYGKYENDEGNMVNTADIRVRDLVLLGSKNDSTTESEESVPF
jgi:single-strand DNA-binding protein